ncbi:MAG: DUF1858 domain-containing protein [Epsilonproteobacteria bacterium]|nr:DUF1858 domain-containing protein [Campylobacterota bacterium]
MEFTLKKEIKMDTTVAELLNDYKGMKDILISINPKFKKLNNPILRRTLAKLATVKQAAIIGGMDAYELLNKLRVAVGQEPIQIDEKEQIIIDESRPSWANKEPIAVLDANELLDKGKNPLAEAHKLLKKLKKDETLKIVSDFRPEPLIEEFEKQGYEVASFSEDKKIYQTVIRKSK